MAGERREFRRADTPEPHAARTRAILAVHPEVRELIGRNPWSFAVIGRWEARLTSIPWNRLPALRRAAPEFYDDMVFHGSWTGLLLRFLFDPDLTLFSRMGRPHRQGTSAGLRS